LRTNLIFHHGVADVLDQAAKRIRILRVVQETCEVALLLQWRDVLKNDIQLPIEARASDGPSPSKGMKSPFEGLPPFFLLDLTLRNGRG
jgi:hypothetical protein